MGKWVWIFGGVFGGIGSVMLVAAILVSASTLTFRTEAQSAPGTVVALDSGKPVVEYADPDGATHRIVGSVSSNPPAYDVGERVTVRYRPGQPAEARIDGLMETWFGPTLLGFLGTISRPSALASSSWRSASGACARGSSSSVCGCRRSTPA